MANQRQNTETDVKEIRLDDIYKPLTEENIQNMSSEIDAWKEKYRDRILLIEVPGTSVCPVFNGIFRIPTKMEMESLSRKKDLSGIDSDIELARLCVLYPEPITFNMLLNANWGIATPIAHKLMSESQINAQASIKKL